VGDADIVPVLVTTALERWNEPDGPQAAIAKALTSFRDDRAVPVFRKGVTDADQAVRAQSAFGLTLIDTPTTQQLLRDALRELSWWQARPVRRGIRIAKRRNRARSG
jgi:hypothetical protein